MLSPETLGLLRQCWKARRSRYDTAIPVQDRWLFPGNKRGKPMTTRQLSRLFHEAADAAGIKKAVTLHALATASRPTCSSAVPISELSRRCSVITNWTQRRITRVSQPA